MSIPDFRFLLLILFLGISAFFSASETSLFALSRYHLEGIAARNPYIYGILSHLLLYPRRLLTTILMGSEIFASLTAILVTSIFQDLVVGSRGWEVVSLLTIVTTTPFIVLLGDVTPKMIALKSPISVASLVAQPLAIFNRFITPVRWIFFKIADSLISLIIGPRKGAPPLSDTDYLAMVDIGHEEGIIQEEERRLIHNIFEFGDLTVAEVMTPKQELYLIPLSKTLPEIVADLRTIKFSRIPVYREQPDDIVGILFAKHLLKLKGVEAPSIESLLFPAYVVPLRKKAEALFREFQKYRIHMAMVVDEYGKLSGVVTMENLLEAIFGEIRDERDKE